MQDTVQRGKDDHSPHLLTLLSNRLGTCRNLLSELQAMLADLSPELTPTHEKLVSILRSIAAANTRSKVSLTFVHYCIKSLTSLPVSSLRGPGV